QAAVELEDDGAAERGTALGIDVRQRVELVDLLDGLDVGLGQHPLLALDQPLIEVGEGADGDLGNAVRAHLLDARLQAVAAHGRAMLVGSYGTRTVRTFAPPGAVI